jgi:hypothetical protein
MAAAKGKALQMFIRNGTLDISCVPECFRRKGRLASRCRPYDDWFAVPETIF